MENTQFYNSCDSVKSILTLSEEEEFDIRKFMNYDLLKRLLLSYPTESSLLDISCILINNRIREGNVKTTDSDKLLK